MDYPDSAFFLHIIKHGTLSGAARALGMTPAAISKKLSSLERQLGVQLLHRTTRSMHITEEGRAFATGLGGVLDELERLHQNVAGRGHEASGLLRVNAPLNFGRAKVAPLMSEFALRYPKLEIELILSDHPYNLIEGGFDVGLCFGTQPNSGLHCRRLSINKRHLWASPTYLVRHGTPLTPKDLSQHNCIVVPRDDDTYGLWTLTRGDHSETIKVRGVLRCNDSEVALAWALEGQGILMRSGWDTVRYMRSDALHMVLGDYSLPNRDLYVVFHHRSAGLAKIRAFIDLAVERLSDLEVIEPILHD